MAVGYSQLPELLPVAGIRWGITQAGVRYKNRRDLVVMELASGSTVAAAFTRNAFCAAPVTVAREHLAAATPRYLLINTGNANAGTGAPGLAAARECCAGLAGLAGIGPEQILPFSTGVIGEPLPVERIVAGLPAALAALDAGGWAEAAHGIMTTDTVAKGLSKQVEIAGKTITVTGIAKGSGMIRPDMATMLSYIATDAAVSRELLQEVLDHALNHSFNRVTVDGDTSTNDACVLVATGAAGVTIDAPGATLEALGTAITDICRFLAQLLIRDGEGATKFVSVRVGGGRDTDECLRVAYTVAHSPLVKTALSASDPNWGRILAAVGRAGVENLVLEDVEIYLDEVCIVRQGARAADYTEEQGKRVMSQAEFLIDIRLGRGSVTETVWTCDFSAEYVRINADYRS
ncbi:MAG TPA: bifunctional glutamate N-acetyltransferase/amino-acid acetyltransferase ArgJ [Gammaproteobacteria bacterium]